jgi:hypothetical protein
MRSENSNLSPLLREAFDGKPLAVLNRGENRYAYREPHVSILGMITPDELLETLKGRSEMHKGTAFDPSFFDVVYATFTPEQEGELLTMNAGLIQEGKRYKLTGIVEGRRKVEGATGELRNRFFVQVKEAKIAPDPFDPPDPMSQAPSPPGEWTMEKQNDREPRTSFARFSQAGDRSAAEVRTVNRADNVVREDARGDERPSALPSFFVIPFHLTSCDKITRGLTRGKGAPYTIGAYRRTRAASSRLLRKWVSSSPSDISAPSRPKAVRSCWMTTLIGLVAIISNPVAVVFYLVFLNAGRIDTLF